MLNLPSARRGSVATSNADGHSDLSSNQHLNRSHTSQSPERGGAAGAGGGGSPSGGGGGGITGESTFEGEVVSIGAISNDSPRIAPLGTLRAVGIGHSVQVVETKGSDGESDVAAASRNTFRGVGHTKFILSVAFSPDGSLVATGSGDQLVILWDVKSGSRRSALIGHNSGVRSVHFSHDGLFLASGSSDHNVILWDVLRGNQRAQLKGHSMEINSVCFAPDSSFLYSAGVDKTIFVWDLRSPVVQLLTKITGHTGHIQSIAASPDGNYLLSTGSDRTILVWETSEYKQVNELSKHTREIHTIAFSVDGTQFATGGSDSLIVVWNAQTFTEHTTLKGHTNRVMSVAFSASGNLLASASMDKSIGIWDPNGGSMKGRLYEHGHQVYSVCFPRGMTSSGAAPLMASGSFSSNFILWDIVRGKVGVTLEGHHKESNVAKVEWMQLKEASHRLLIKSTDFNGEEVLWDAESGRTTQLDRVIEQEAKLREMDDIRIHQEKMTKLSKQREQQADAEKKAEAARKAGDLDATADDFTGSPSVASYDAASVAKLESLISALPSKIANVVGSPDAASSSYPRRRLTEALSKAGGGGDGDSGHQGESRAGMSMDGQSQFGGGGGGAGGGAFGEEASFGSFGKKNSFTFGSGLKSQQHQGHSGGGGGGSGAMDTDAILNAIAEVRDDQLRMSKDMQDLQKDVTTMQSEFKTISHQLGEVLKLLAKK